MEKKDIEDLNDCPSMSVITPPSPPSIHISLRHNRFNRYYNSYHNQYSISTDNKKVAGFKKIFRCTTKKEKFL